MSHNLILGNFPLIKTKTEFTWRVLDAHMGRYQIAEAYFREYLQPMVPVLRGRDMTNTYKVAEAKCAQTVVDAKYELLLAYLKANPDVQWRST